MRASVNNCVLMTSACLTLLFCSAPRVCADELPGLVAHWTLDELQDAAYPDSAGGHHATPHGTLGGQSGVVGTGVEFSNTADEYLDCGDALQLADGNQATLTAFVCPWSFNPPDARNIANSRNGIVGSANAALIFALSCEGRPTFVWHAGGLGYQETIAEADGAVVRDRYSHVAVVRDGGSVRFYVDGKPVGEATGLSDANFDHFTALHIGRVNNSAARDFDGLIDDVRIYNRALDDDEIAKLAVPLKSAPPVVVDERLGARGLERVKFNNPGLVVDLAVGLWTWPLPMDYDGDGDYDLVVSCPDTPYNGTYLFENTQGNVTFPVFRPARRIGAALSNPRVSYVDGQPHVLVPGGVFADPPKNGFTQCDRFPLPENIHAHEVRANQWHLVDYDADGRQDLIIGVGDWKEYGWDNAFDSEGRWTRGPLHGWVYLVRNTSSAAEVTYAAPEKLMAGGEPVDVFGMPSPNLADFDNDGDLDLLCGEFVDSFTYYENIGTRSQPEYAPGRKLMLDGKPLTVHLCMHVPTAFDWDRDGDLDLIVGQEDGRVMFIEHTGRVEDGLPVFAAPRFFQQEADHLKYGVLVTPVSVDWDQDGDEDLICGNSAGNIGFIENLDGGNPPRWAAPVDLKADGEVLRIMAGPNGSIQGPCEAKWGYMTLSVADWDHDGLLDLVVNSIWGKVVWYRNIGTPTEAQLAAAAPVEVEWPGTPPKPAWTWWNPAQKELATQWRTTPVVYDLNNDGLNDLVMLDHEGYLAFFERQRRDGQLVLLPPQRIFHDAAADPAPQPDQTTAGKPLGEPLRLNNRPAGGSGRRKLCLVDWNRDGKLDLLANSVSIDWFENVSSDADARILLRHRGTLDSRRLAGHSTSPTVVDWDRNGVPDLLVGAEDGHFYFKMNRTRTTR